MLRIVAGLVFFSAGTTIVLGYPPAPGGMPPFDPLTQMGFGGLLEMIGDALAYAHGEGVVHRDLKPENILLERAGAVGDDDVPPRVRLLDVGIATFPSRDLGVGVAREGGGTTHFLSPEQAFGDADIDARSDIFALGALGYLMLIGAVPFDGPSTAAIIARICAGERVPLRVAASEAPADLVAIIDRCLATNPAERWRSTRELREALARSAGGVRLARTTVPRRRRTRARGAPTQRRGEWDATLAPEERSARSRWMPRMFSGVGADLRFAVRSLRKTPAFTATAIITLALGVSATTVVFSVAEALVLRKLPVADPASLVVLQERLSDGENTDFGAVTVRYDRYLAFREATHGVFTDVALQRFTPLSVRLGAQARPAIGLVTSGNYFDLLGVRPMLGHFYSSAEDTPARRAPVAVVGYAFWRGVLGGDHHVIGKTLWVDSRPLTVVAVAPAGFNGALAGAFTFDVWVPDAAYRVPPASSPDTAVAPVTESWGNVFARLRPGIDVARASAALRVIGPRVGSGNPRNRVLDAWVDPVKGLPREIEKPAERFMAILLAIAALVLLIAATNASGMLVARSASRRRELATRLAVGASAARVMRQLLAESTLLCCIAGAIALLLTWPIMRLVQAWQLPSPLQLAVQFRVDGAVLAAAAVIVLGTAVLAGLVPAMQATRIDLAVAMKEGGLRGGTRRTRLRSAFVVAQVALSVVLLAVAGLFARSLERTMSIDPGFEATRVVHGGVNLGAHGYDDTRAAALFTQLVARLRARPDVAAAAWATNAPLSGHQATSDMRREDRMSDKAVNVQWAGAGFLELVHVTLVGGRTFTQADAEHAPPVMVINETLAERFWPGERLDQVIGRAVHFYNRAWTVVGVVGNGKYTLLQEPPAPFAYVPFAQEFSRGPMLYVRSRGDTGGALAAMRAELAALDPNVALDRPTLLTDDVDKYLIPQQVGAGLVGIFGLVGLALAMTGLYGVLSYAVAQREREFGVRIALGAEGRDVVRLVVRDGLALVVAGVALGLAGAFVAGRLIATFLFGLDPADPVTLIAVPLVLVTVALLATAIPARRAAMASPMMALRAE